MALMISLALLAALPALAPCLPPYHHMEKIIPQVEARVEGGYSSQEGSTLGVYPGAVVHLDCLYPRSMGNPDWTWTSPLTNYLTGWSVSEEEKDWKYKLTIYYTKSEDTGIYTCNTPRGLSSSITLLVAEVNCGRSYVEPVGVLSATIEGTRLGQSVQYSCPFGYRLNGTSTLTCRTSGDWSSVRPNCEKIECPTLSVRDERLIISQYNRSLGSRVFFSCPWGDRLDGPTYSDCQEDSRWSSPSPICYAIRCPDPIVPENGRIIEEASYDDYRVGAVVHFSCFSSHKLQGEQSIVCTDSGVWSNSSPQCAAVCEYPGEPANGRLVPLKFTYLPGDRLKVTCHPGFVTRLDGNALDFEDTSEPSLAAVLLDAAAVCLESGQWSNPLPICKNYTDV